jgi:hypothetical protein
VLWSRSDTGQAALWELDPTTSAVVKGTWLHSSSGVGAPWQATAYTQLDATTGYVLWSRSDTGRAVLWKVNSETGAIVSSASLASRTGVGGPWLATGYTQVDDTTGYVLWTRSDSGRGVLWKVDPSVPDVIPVVSSANLYSASGVGAGWQATKYTHVNDTTGYVLWTKPDQGKAALWRIDPSQKGTIGIGAVAPLFSPKGVGAPWQATSYTHVDDTTGYVLWTRADTGRAVLWKVDPGATGTIPIVSLSNVSAASGIGSRWRATAYTR